MGIDFISPHTSGTAKRMKKSGKRVSMNPFTGNLVLRHKNKFFELIRGEKAAPSFAAVIFLVCGYTYDRQYILALGLSVNNGTLSAVPVDSETIFNASNLTFQSDPAWNMNCFIQSNNDNSKHISIIANVEYAPFMSNFGLSFMEGSFYKVYGTQWGYRPSSFLEGADLIENQTFYSNITRADGIHAMGRVNYTLSSDGLQMVSHDNSLWKEEIINTFIEGDTGITHYTKSKWYMRYITEASSPNMTDGNIIDYDEMSYLTSGGDVSDNRTRIYAIGIISKDKALYYKIVSASSSTSSSSMWMEYVSWAPGIEHSTASFSSTESRTSTLIWGSITIESGAYSGSSSSDSAVDGLNYTNTMHSASNGLLNISTIDYANYGENTGIIFYKSHSVNISESSSESYEWGVGFDYSHSLDGHNTIDHYIGIVIGGAVQNVLIASCSDSYNDSGASSSGQFITNVACHASEDKIVYTYVLNDIDLNTEALPQVPADIGDLPHTFNKRVIGIIDIATGQRKEIDITESNAASILTDMYADYDYKHFAAIGRHAA